MAHVLQLTFYFVVSLSRLQGFSESQDDTISLLKDWILQHDGAFIHPLLEVRTDGNGSRGLFVTGDIPYGERLLEVPWGAIISGATAITPAGLPPGLLTLVGQVTKGVDPHLLALALQVYRARWGQGPAAAQLQPFIKSLPGENESNTGPLSLWLEDAAVDRCFAALGASEDEMRGERNRWQKTLSSLIANWTAATHEENPPSREPLAWALAVAATRTFGAKWSTIKLSQNSILQKRWGTQTLSDADVVAIENRNGNTFSPLMVPFADFMNHAVPPTASFDFMIGRGLVVSALRKDDKMPVRSGDILHNVSLPKGSEVLISYGMHDNDHLFKVYGFVIPDNVIRSKLRFPLHAAGADRECATGDSVSFTCKAATLDKDAPFGRLIWLQGPKSGGQLPRKEHFDEILAHLHNRSGSSLWTADDTLHLAESLQVALHTLKEAAKAAPPVCMAYSESTIAQLESSLLRFLQELADFSELKLPSIIGGAGFGSSDDATWRALLRAWLQQFGHATLDASTMRRARAIDAHASSVLADALMERTEFESMQRSWMGSQI